MVTAFFASARRLVVLVTLETEQAWAVMTGLQEILRK